jgi:hypothetical protein
MLIGFFCGCAAQSPAGDSAAKLLTIDEARRIAANIAKLPAVARADLMPFPHYNTAMQDKKPPDDLSIGKGLFSLALVLIAGALVFLLFYLW